MEYYVLSLRWTVGEDYITFWRPNNSGYTTDINQAGRYSQEAIINNPTYYDDCKTTLAVPCEEVEQWVWRVIHSDNLKKLLEPRGIKYQDILEAKVRG